MAGYQHWAPKQLVPGSSSAHSCSVCILREQTRATCVASSASSSCRVQWQTPRGQQFFLSPLQADLWSVPLHKELPPLFNWQIFREFQTVGFFLSRCRWCGTVMTSVIQGVVTMLSKFRISAWGLRERGVHWKHCFSPKGSGCFLYSCSSESL